MRCSSPHNFRTTSSQLLWQPASALYYQSTSVSTFVSLIPTWLFLSLPARCVTWAASTIVSFAFIWIVYISSVCLCIDYISLSLVRKLIFSIHSFDVGWRDQKIRYLLRQRGPQPRWQSNRNQAPILQAPSYARLPLLLDGILHRLLHLVRHRASPSRDSDNFGSIEGANLD